jgi:hypothetical protein
MDRTKYHHLGLRLQWRRKKLNGSSHFAMLWISQIERFEKFVSKSVIGTDLGLYIARGIVESHCGRI